MRSGIKLLMGSVRAPARRLPTCLGRTTTAKAEKNLLPFAIRVNIPVNARRRPAPAGGLRPEPLRGRLRHLGVEAPPTARPISAEEIRSLRESANLSQAASARYPNLTTGYISQLERGAKQPKGPALALLNVIRRKGFEAIL